MQLTTYRLVRIFNKIIHLGPKKSIGIIQNRIRKKIFRGCWHSRALQHKANHNWKNIARKFNVSTSFECFFITVKQSSFDVKKFLHLDMKSSEICDRADEYVNKKFDILGSGKQQFENIPWHIDIRLKKQNPHADYTFPADQFYQNIMIGIGEGDNFIKDIKVPWELSRCQHLLVLAQAYEKTGNSIYVQTFQEHISDWIKNNPFMLGPNWVCPMEVGLRALNWIVALEYFKHSSISLEFWQSMVTSLYDHMFYLENNWEIYDGKTSNHYLSDLIGYFYLCHFFKEFDGVAQKRTWCFSHILSECEKQVFAEGTSYEGSTSYHRLVTELFLHGYIVARIVHLEIPTIFVNKLTKMLEFIDWCTPINGMLVTIGDNDSGCVTTAGITREMQGLFLLSECCGRKDFSEFGLSIIKTEALHITLRHHSYQAKQPSGHFHNDIGSITLAINGVPIFIDPGSYVYTPSRIWRNNFRSASKHNTFFLEGKEPVQFDDRLFALQIHEKKSEIICNRKYSLKAEHMLYEKDGIMILREINLSECAKILYMQDCISTDESFLQVDKKMLWNFTVSSEIQLQFKNDACYFIYQQKPIASISTDLDDMHSVTSWNSSEYGQKQPTLSLQGSCAIKNFEIKKNFKIFLIL